MDDEADLASSVKFRLTKALASNECCFAISNNGSGMQTENGSTYLQESTMFLPGGTDEPNRNVVFYPVRQCAEHFPVCNFGIVNQEFLLCSVYVFCELLACIHRADDKRSHLRLKGLARDIRLDQSQGFLNQLAFFGDNAEPAAMRNIEVGK